MLHKEHLLTVATHYNSLKQYKLTVLEIMRISEDQIELYRIMHGFKNTDKSYFLRLGRQTPLEDIIISKENCKLDFNKCSRGIANIWNKLPTDCVNATV